MTRAKTPTEVATSSFAIVANGFADGPAQALRDYLVQHGARVTTVFHPLSPEQGTRHRVTEYSPGRAVRSRSISVPLRPPLSFAADPFVPLRLPRVDVWFGFNPLACARGLLAGRFRRADRVVLWSVDFVPARFGRTPLTSLYDRLDRLGCERADARIELSAQARDARNRHHGLRAELVPTYVVPMGAWLERVPVTASDGYRRRRVVFLGHLVPRQGVATLLDAIALLRERDETVSLDVVGDGPQLPELRARSNALGLAGAVRFHGFVSDVHEVERILAGGSIAVAPYEPSEETFSRYADPGKLKAYLAAGLPIVLTEVPPNARELAREGGAELVAYEPAAIADAIDRGLASAEGWTARREAARTYARRFDWALLLDELLGRLGFES